MFDLSVEYPKLQFQLHPHVDSSKCWCRPSIVTFGIWSLIVHSYPNEEPPMEVLKEAVRGLWEDARAESAK